MDYFLACRSGAEKGRTWKLAQGTYTIGRDSDCDVVLPDRSVSRVHCRVTVDGGTVTLADLESANGSWRNGQKISTCTLSPGDELRLGSISLLLSGEAAISDSFTDTENDDTVSLADTDSLLLREEQDARTIGQRPDTILDLASVCSLGRELSRTKNRSDLLKALTRRLRRHLSPSAIYLLTARSDSAFAEEQLFAVRGSPMLTTSVREDMARIVLHQHEGRRALAEFQSVDGKSIGIVVAPTILGNRQAPTLIVELETLSKATMDRILDYVLAVSITLGPLLETIERTESLAQENERLASSSVGKVLFIGESPRIAALLKEVSQVANTPMNVLITGETGVGKELIAKILHDSSERRAKNLVVVNSPAISHELFASQMFGHRRGAFTGAQGEHKGYAQLADGGTLFLDEVADLSPENQAALLRFVESKTFFPVGGDTPKSVDVRIVAATNARLPRLVAEGRFRSDLYHRLAAVHISIPPLRERPEDIPGLVHFFLDQSLRYARRPILGITDEAIQLLRVQRWPGNTRELKNAIERSVVLAQSEWITGRDVLSHIESPEAASSFESLIDGSPTLDEIQRRYVAHVFNSCGGNGVKAGKILGLPKSTVYDRLRKYGILGTADPEA